MDKLSLTIVKRKEIRSVEFCSRVNKLQIDRIDFIEHISFNSLNEGIRFKNTMYKAKELISKNYNR